MQELKDQYAAVTLNLEQRIAALEQQIETQGAAAKSGTVSAAELAAETAYKSESRSDQVGATLQGALASNPAQ